MVNNSSSTFVINLLTCHFNRYEGIIPRLWTKPNRHTNGQIASTVETGSVLSEDLAWRTETDRQTVWCQLSLLSISRHHSSSCCYGQPTPPWQPTGCKSSVWGRKRKRAFVCHAITFKRWWHVSKSLSVAPLSFFVSLLWPFLYSFSSSWLCLLSLLLLVFPLFLSSLKLCLVVTSSPFSQGALRLSLAPGT